MTKNHLLAFLLGLSALGAQPALAQATGQVTTPVTPNANPQLARPQPAPGSLPAIQPVAPAAPTVAAPAPLGQAPLQAEPTSAGTPSKAKGSHGKVSHHAAPGVTETGAAPAKPKKSSAAAKKTRKAGAKKPAKKHADAGSAAAAADAKPAKGKKKPLVPNDGSRP